MARRHWFTRRGFKASVATILCFTLALAPTVTATNWGGPKDAGDHCNDDPVVSQCLNDPSSSNISVIIQTSDTQIAGNLRWSMLNYTQVTDLYVFETDAGEPQSRVKARAAFYTASWWSSTACEYPGLPTIYGGSEAAHTRWCRPQVIRYNLSKKASKFPGDTAQRDISCHEFGHTLGLRHATSTANGGSNWASSCMVYASTTHTTTTQHDRDHINAYY